MLSAIRRRIHLSQRDDGFTLVELVVALMIIGGVLLALIAVQISASATIVDARKREQATAVANQAMEQLRAIPWAYLSKGMYNGFATAGGGDTHVSGSTLNLPSGNKTLVIAPSAGNQDLTKPRPPLFQSSGSNMSVQKDAAVTGVSYSVWAYVTQPSAGAVNTVDLVVIVEWTSARGQTAQTILQSTAFRGSGCGSELTSPYLGACQAFYDGASNSGRLTTSVRALTYAGGVTTTPALTLLYPTSDPFSVMQIRSAGAGAYSQSQQVTNVMAAAEFGGSYKDDNNPATEPSEQGWTRGFAIKSAAATDDVTQANTPLHVGTTTLTQSSGAEPEWSLSASGTNISFSARSDFLRPATGMASSTTSCKTGIPAGQPCAIANIGNYPQVNEGSGYILMTIQTSPSASQIFRLSRRLAEQTPPSNADEAWVSRFKSAASTNAAVGCSTVTGSGCMSAGATRAMAKLAIGTVVGSSWSGSAAPDGLVVVEGASGCTGGSNAGFTESVLAQRGTSQSSTAGTFSRCGQVRWWTGGSYSTAGFSAASGGPYTTAPVTWSGSGYTVTATATVTLTAGSSVNIAPDTTCKSDGCTVQVSSGVIIVDATYVITYSGNTYAVISSTTIDGPSARVTFQEAPVA